MSWATRTEHRKDAGRPNSRTYWADRGRRDATVRSRSAAALRGTKYVGRPGARELSINHLAQRSAASETSARVTLEAINPDDLSRPETYTQVMVARGSRLVFVAGQVAEDAEGNLVGAGDLEAQT